MSIFQAERERKQNAEYKRQRNEIQKQLDAIDRSTVRPLRAKLAGTDTQDDRDKLDELETEAAALRDQLAAIPDTETAD